MQTPRTLLRNTRASLRFHKRLIMFLVALLVIVLGVVALSSALNAPGFIAAGDASTSNSTDTDGGTTVNWGTGGSTTGQYSVYTTTDPTPTPNHPTATPTNPPTTPTTTPFMPFTDTPEYGLGGGLLAVFVAFVAFTLFLRRSKKA